MTAVLVAEDDLAQLQGITTILRQAGFRVYAANTGSEAIAVGARIKPDAAICDWNLGDGPDGAEVASALQAQNPDLVPIFITGNDVTKLEARTRDLRDAAYLSKPVTPERLVKALTSAGCDPDPRGRN